MRNLVIFIVALSATAAVTPLVILAARRMGWVVMPRKDRWHQKPTAMLGGVAIFLGVIGASLFFGIEGRKTWAFFICATAMFLVGLWDDIREMSPQVKFLAQIIICSVAVSLGVSLDQEVIPWRWVSIPLSVFWMVGITNSVNILDNMDGLSSGVVFVASTVLCIGSMIIGQPMVEPYSAVLAGAALGFLIYNFNPAKIFMGDCGSLFLGFSLSGLTIMSTNTSAGASQIIMALMIPLGALVVPIFDTTLVSFQRTSHGRSIAQGGRDHSSHRLVFLGLSERKAVLILLGISAVSGGLSILLVNYATPLVAMVIIALFVVPLVFFGIYLAEVKVYKDKSGKRIKNPIWDQVLLHKKQILQIAVDLILVSAAFTGAWLLRYDGTLTKDNADTLALALPWFIAGKMLSFWAFGLYKGQWRYVSVYDAVQFFKAALAGSVIAYLLVSLIYGMDMFSRSVVILDFILCFMLISGTRSLIRVFREKLNIKKGVPVLIVGAGDGGELLLRELGNNPHLGFKPVGFVDDDPAKQKDLIHGVPVLGSSADLDRLIEKHGIQRVFISILSAGDQSFEDIRRVCRDSKVRCSRTRSIVRWD